ncbi:MULTISPECIES: phosphatidate cytidylyltransferase [Alphaproteobacteria]|uniref:Phosphatidate cytidylyltransferase n=2 Tax=Alphaproteobacteria TaxID=28211 RepID=A0A512HHM3_9HYPH|nr:MULTISPECIES: phosphatidate cytidylyltransferase [Alphaproteobacteria]GEO84948.1 phosphatidate cytidylyltransferase [Ciceribacter naphthalenivorans]GLR22882.1 phosphatidate cytidylyltransferase [Ciceribacter naphthalenivorans]GLT05738.1 phosphatidate cytidylyltransferase [Sphingomonas psychrolutea]
MSRELTLRVYSAIVMVIVVLAATWFGGLAFRILAGAIGLLVYYEWSSMTKLAERSMRGHAFGWLSLAAIVANMLFGAPDLTVPLFAGLALTAVLPALTGHWSWWQPGGIFYSGLSAIALSAIRGDDQLGLAAMIFVFAVVWSTDILAYFVGRAIGGPKLAPRISPGKTWSGAIGGTVAGVLGGTAVALSFFQSIDLWVPFLAFFLSVSGQIGDLFESFIKRRFGVKDSSHLIPGHGGVMDRVDALVFACFAAFFLAIGFSAVGMGAVDSLGAFFFGF